METRGGEHVTFRNVHVLEVGISAVKGNWTIEK